MITTVSQPLATRAKLFDRFSDASRVALVEALRAGSRNVGNVVDETGLGQSNVSNHRARLPNFGLVVSEPRGRFVSPGLSDPWVDELLRMADLLLAEVAVRVEPCGRCDAPEDA